MKMCMRCDIGKRENTNNIVMHCPFFADDSQKMHDCLRALNDDDVVNMMFGDSQELFHILMGKQSNTQTISPFADMMNVWLISGYHISNMYKGTRIGMGSK